jgi:hypothetical protein
MARRTYVYRDGKMVEVSRLKNRYTLPTLDADLMDKRDGIMELDDIRQDYQKSSDRDRLAYEKSLRQRQEFLREKGALNDHSRR